MGIFFSKTKKASRVTEHDKAVLQLKTQRDNLKRYQLRIEATLENERILAKKLLAEGMKDRARLLLKKKRYQEQLLEKTDGQLENLEKLTQDLEFAQLETKVVDGLKVGSIALKKINEMLNIADIEKILDETREGIEKQKEIDELLSGALTEDDEQLVEDELNELIDQTETVQLPDIPSEPVPEPIKETEKPVRRKEAVMVAS